MTIQTAQPLALRQFVRGAFLALVPAFLLWWLSVDILIAGLRPMVAWLAHFLMPITVFAPDAQHGWKVLTSLEVMAPKTTPGPEIATFSISASALRQQTLGFPLLLALMLAPPRPPRLLGRLLAGISGLTLLYLLSACVVAFCSLAVLVNHQPLGPAQLPPAFYVAWPDYSQGIFLLARFGLAVLGIVPLAAPPVLALLLNPVARQTLMDFRGGRPHG